MVGVPRRTTLLAGLTLVLLLAGCTGSSPGGTETPTSDTVTVGDDTPTAETDTRATTTPTDGDPASMVDESDRVAVEGELPVNATRIYQRVERLLNVSGEPPTVRVVERDRPIPEPRPSPTESALGFGQEAGNLSECGPLAAARTVDGEVQIDPRNLSADVVELTLAHEFVHTLQPQFDGFESPRKALAQPNGLALIEGSAVYATDRYAQRYDTRWAGKRPLALRGCLYRQAESQIRLLSGSYYWGGRYFEERLDSPAALSTVFTSPPRTTEQLIHGETPETEPPVALSVNGSGWDSRRSGGELLLRTWLTTELAGQQAVNAANGWGNDTILLHSGEQYGAAWVLRWDTEADADEFVSAVTTLATALESRDATSVRSVRLSPKTTVVFAGPEPWVDNATASGSNETVTVSLG